MDDIYHANSSVIHSIQYGWGLSGLYGYSSMAWMGLMQYLLCSDGFRHGSDEKTDKKYG